MAKVLHEKFDKLEEILRGISAVGELTLRTNDLVVSYGERLSSRIVAAAFEYRGISSAHIDARSCIMTDNHFDKAVPQPAAIEAKLLEHVLPLIEVRVIPVMGGFIGSTEKGITTTLGSGGSDYTASRGRRHARRRDRDMDGCQRDYDDRPAHLPGRVAGEDGCSKNTNVRSIWFLQAK